jgi:hypothetical protein
MQTQYHILNGDSLNEQFPDSISGEIIITRECLVDGDVSGETLEDFYLNRAKFIEHLLNKNDTDFYYQKSVVEFRKIQNIPEMSEINLWFEDDLFCQVHLWFVFYLLNENNRSYQIFLVRPNVGNEYSFGKMNDFELLEAYQNKIKLELTEILKFGKFWDLYRKKEVEKMVEIANKLNDKFRFLLPAVFAFSELIPTNGRLSKPVQTVSQLITEIKTFEFDPIFKEFCKREAIYGFGDLQVQRILNELTSS